VKKFIFKSCESVSLQTGRSSVPPSEGTPSAEGVPLGDPDQLHRPIDDGRLSIEDFNMFFSEKVLIKNL
jgi:predicted pyridoxine 5'-phosphate oxidase superfamily flavin-nucleotide-binding protein